MKAPHLYMRQPKLRYAGRASAAVATCSARHAAPAAVAIWLPLWVVACGWASAKSGEDYANCTPGLAKRDKFCAVEAIYIASPHNAVQLPGSVCSLQGEAGSGKSSPGAPQSGCRPPGSLWPGWPAAGMRSPAKTHPPAAPGRGQMWPESAPHPAKAHPTHKVTGDLLAAGLRMGGRHLASTLRHALSLSAGQHNLQKQSGATRSPQAKMMFHILLQAVGQRSRGRCFKRLNRSIVSNTPAKGGCSRR